MQNPNCDGSGPCSMGEVRTLPTSSDPAGGNAILCRQCHARELAWREERNKELEPANRFPLPEWGSLEVYQSTTGKLGQISLKPYACKVCGYQKQIETNHWGECYSYGNWNTCPQCPPFKRPNTWICQEAPPAGMGIPEPWSVVKLGEVAKVKTRKS